MLKSDKKFPLCEVNETKQAIWMITNWLELQLVLDIHIRMHACRYGGLFIAFVLSINYDLNHTNDVCTLTYHTLFTLVERIHQMTHSYARSNTPFTTISVNYCLFLCHSQWLQLFDHYILYICYYCFVVMSKRKKKNMNAKNVNKCYPDIGWFHGRTHRNGDFHGKCWKRLERQFIFRKSIEKRIKEASGRFLRNIVCQTHFNTSLENTNFDAYAHGWFVTLIVVNCNRNHN